jgi:hypothetical protein
VVRYARCTSCLDCHSKLLHCTADLITLAVELTSHNEELRIGIYVRIDRFEGPDGIIHHLETGIEFAEHKLKAVILWGPRESTLIEAQQPAGFADRNKQVFETRTNYG